MGASRKFFLALMILMTASSWTKAEYRAFLLSIKSPDEEAPRLVKSSLDPVQYGGYYPLGPKDVVTYIDTWRCPGRTGGMQPICKSPREIAEENAEAAAGDAAKSVPLTKPDETPTSKSLERKPASN